MPGTRATAGRNKKTTQPPAPKPSQRSKLSTVTTATRDVDDMDEDDEDGAASDASYETAPDEENYEIILKQLYASDQRKKDAGRKKRKANFDADMASLKERAQGVKPEAAEAACQNTKAVAERLLKVLKKRSELEEQYLNAAQDLKDTYVEFGGELLVTLKGRMGIIERNGVREKEAELEA